MEGINFQDSDRILSRFRTLPIDVVARHEVGHAVAAYRCGGWVKRIVFGSTASVGNYGRASFAIPTNEHNYLLVLSAGPLALFIHDCPPPISFRRFLSWIDTEEGYAKAISGAGDWSEILQRNHEPEGESLDDFLERAVEPYFDETCRLLDQSRQMIEGLTILLLDHPPGLGPWTLKRFFAGKPPSPWAMHCDRPGVRWGSSAMKRWVERQT